MQLPDPGARVFDAQCIVARGFRALENLNGAAPLEVMGGNLADTPLRRPGQFILL